MRTARNVLLVCVLALCLTLSAAVACASQTPVYLDDSYSFAERAADLIARMSDSEKATQMISSRAVAIPRLGVEAYGWWNEALHGVARLQYNPTGNATVLWNTTQYPVPLSMASTWDPELIYEMSVMISDEAREVVPDNRLCLSFWSPTINLARDPRWGRNDEAYSEDPYLTAKIAGQFVNGMEGKDMDGNLLPVGGGYLKSITPLKHYAANNSENNRRFGTSDMDERTLREYYTAAFRDIVKETDVRSVMTAYNRVNGVPATASVYLIDNLLRQTWGFSGYVTSDCDSIMDISESHKWIPPGWDRPITQVERMAFALSSGVDLNCSGGYRDDYNYANTLPRTLRENITTETGLFTINDVDTALLRLFTARMQLGEFDDPDKVPWVVKARQNVPPYTWDNSDANQAITQTPERVEMAYKVAADALVLLKNAAVDEGKLLPLRIPESGEFKVAVIGYLANPSSLYLGGYSSNQGPSADLINGYEGIKRAVLSINPDAEVIFHPGFTAVDERRAFSQAASLTEIDPQAVKIAEEADVAIVYVGTDRSVATEGRDRDDLRLPGAQGELAALVGKANPNTIVYMETIGMVEVGEFEPYVAAMLWSCYNGQHKGRALANVLLGVEQPSGRLPFTWYKTTEQLPDLFDYAIRPSETQPGRTYMYFTDPVDYPFGFGLTYTTFEYSNLQINQKSFDANETIEVSFDVTNTGTVKGAEVAQLYVTTPEAPAELERPIKRLKAFQKVELEPGETRTVTLKVAVPDLAFFDEELGKYVVDNGRYGIQVGSSSANRDIKLQEFVWITGELEANLAVVTVKPTQDGDFIKDIPKRVIFDRNAVVIPNITVALTDESLYGYIARNRSKPLPEGMQISYSSNRPEVVAVDGDLIRTVGSGVATISVDVTYKGVTKSADFVIYVR